MARTTVAVTAVAAIAACGCGAGTTRPKPPRAVRMASPPHGGAVTVAVVGHSVRHRPITAYVVGDPSASRRLLIVGCIHGDERAGEAITRRLRRLSPPAGAAWWVVDEFNPDGCSAGTRQNADGVDLNRNAPRHWRPLDQPGGLFYSGPRPLSEPESRAINRLVRRIRPAISIWFHQHAALVDTSAGGDRAIEARYARAVGLPLLPYGKLPGTVTGWQNAMFPSGTAFVVELPAGRLSAEAVARHVAAIVALSRTGG